MVVVNGIAVRPFPAPFGKRRKYEHANWAIAELAVVLSLIPDDEQGATLFVLVWLENEGHILL